MDRDYSPEEILSGVHKIVINPGPRESGPYPDNIEYTENNCTCKQPCSKFFSNSKEFFVNHCSWNKNWGGKSMCPIECLWTLAFTAKSALSRL